MSKFNLSQIAKSTQAAIRKHSPEILMGLGIAGMITTTVMAVQATPKALRRIDAKKEELDTSKLTPLETIKATWTCYIPAALVGGLSVGCLLGSNSVNLKRNAALATAYTLSESALREYQDKVVETIGEKKEQIVRDALAKDTVEKNPVTNREVIVTDRGNVLCLDVLSKRYFQSNQDLLSKAVNDLNRRMRDENYISMNDYFIEIGLEETDIGDEFGWNIDRGYIELAFSSQIATDGRPCLVVGHYNRPNYEYR